MSRSPLLILVAIASFTTAACDDDASQLGRNPPPTNSGIYGVANGCYTIEAFDGATTLRFLRRGTNDDVYSFSALNSAGGARFHLRASDLGTYLLYDRDRRYFSATSADDGTITFARPATLESRIDRADDNFKSPAEWRLQVSARDATRFQLQHYATDRYLTLSGLSDREQEAAIITLHPAEGCAAFPELGIDAVGAVKPHSWPDGDLYGIAEIHSHMMSDSGFGGGGLFHGAPFHRLGVERALPDCTRTHGKDGRRDLLGYFYDATGSEFDLDALLPLVVKGEVPVFNHVTDGYPKFTEWPSSWRRATHQTMYYRWLERAYLGGLRLLVQLATGNSVLCELTVALRAQKTLYSCNDMVSVDRAIASARALERYIDAQAGGPGKGWLRVVETPAEARQVIESGKLAMVLGIEISNLFDCFLTPPKGFERCTVESVRKKLDHYRALGVRVVFPVHKFDNAFSAGDGHRGIIELGNFINTGHYSSFTSGDCDGLPTTAFDKGDVSFGGLNKPRDVFDAPPPHDFSHFVDNPLATLTPFLADIQKPALKGDYCQKHGLTTLGATLLQELMTRGMLIDVAHLPRRALAEAYAILENNGYPATKTHGSSNGGRIYRIGGLASTSLGRCGDPDKPGTMAGRLTADVAEAVANGAYPSEALSFDLNGLAGGPRPRFGPDARCSKTQKNPVTYPFKSYDGQVTFEQPTLGERKVDFNEQGMIHIGLLPELIEDVRRDGASDKVLEPLFRSAEAYVRMWERAEARAKQLSR